MTTFPELSYKAYGSGKEYIIFLHGYCEIKEMWDDFIPEFSSFFEQYTFLSIDLPGFGQSSIANDCGSLLEVSEYLPPFLKSRKIHSAIWVGHSLGGYVLMNLLAKQEELIKGLCFFHSSIFSDSEEKKKQRNKTIRFIKEQGKEAFISNFIPNLFFQGKKENLKSEIENSIEQAMQNSKSSMIRYMEMMRDRSDFSHLLKVGKIPVLFIAGKNDGSIPLSISKKQVALVQNSKSLFLENCGHMGMFEYPQECANSLKHFISQ